MGMDDSLYGDIPAMMNLIGRLLYCMKECNAKNEHDCEFFRLDFRPANMLDGLPWGALALRLRWGSRDELGNNASS